MKYAQGKLERPKEIVFLLQTMTNEYFFKELLHRNGIGERLGEPSYINIKLGNVMY